MDKFKSILRQTLIFLAIFLVVHYIFQFFAPQEEEIAGGNVILQTQDNEYSISKTVNLEIKNYSKETITIPSTCPKNPLQVARYEQNQWVPKQIESKIDCSDNKEIVLAPGKTTLISYDYWNYELFNELGRYRIEMENQGTTIYSNEFTVGKDGIFRQLWNSVIYKPIYNTLIVVASYLPNHNLGIAIIILTLIIRTILLAPSRKAIQSQKKMQDLQPRLNAIKEKHKGDQQRIAMETMALWKEAKISPMSSCLPLLLQLPFLLAVFHVVKDSINPDNAHLLYTQYNNFNLSEIDPNFLGLDLTKINFYILPLIVGALQFVQMYMMVAKQKKQGNQPKQKEMQMAASMMTYILPILVAVFTATLPAGVGIYWGTSTLYGIIQQAFIFRNADKHQEKDEVKVRVIEKD